MNMSLIMDAAKALVEEGLDRIVRHPYDHQRRASSIMVYAPRQLSCCIEGGEAPIWEGIDQIACVHFDPDRCTLYVYEQYQPVFGIKQMEVAFEYANPAFPLNMLEWIEKIVDHNGLLF